MPSTLSSNEILKELNISRSTFYYLLKHHLINLSTTSTGRYIWDENAITQIKALLKEVPADNEVVLNLLIRQLKSTTGVILATSINCWILLSLR